MKKEYFRGTNIKNRWEQKHINEQQCVYIWA